MRKLIHFEFVPFWINAELEHESYILIKINSMYNTIEFAQLLYYSLKKE